MTNDDSFDITKDIDSVKNDFADTGTPVSVLRQSLPGITVHPQIQKDESGMERLVFSVPLADFAKALDKYRERSNDESFKSDIKWAESQNLHWKILDLMEQGENISDVIAGIAKDKPKGAKNIVGMIKGIVDNARNGREHEWEHAFGGLNLIRTLQANAVRPIALRLFQFRQLPDWNKSRGHMIALAESMCHVRNWARTRHGANDPSTIKFKISPDRLEAEVGKYVTDMCLYSGLAICFQDGKNGLPARCVADSFLEHTHASITREQVFDVLKTEYDRIMQMKKV